MNWSTVPSLVQFTVHSSQCRQTKDREGWWWVWAEVSEQASGGMSVCRLGSESVPGSPLTGSRRTVSGATILLARAATCPETAYGGCMAAEAPSTSGHGVGFPTNRIVNCIVNRKYDNKITQLQHSSTPRFSFHHRCIMLPLYNQLREELRELKKNQHCYHGCCVWSYAPRMIFRVW